MIFFWSGLAVSGWLKATESKRGLGHGGHPRRGSAPVFRKIPPVICSETIRAFMGPSAQIGQVCSALTASCIRSWGTVPQRRFTQRSRPRMRKDRRLLSRDGPALALGRRQDARHTDHFRQKVEADSGHWEKRLCHLQTHAIVLYYAHGKEWARLHPMPDRPGKTIPCRQ